MSSAAIKCATALCTTLANPDLSPHIPTLVKCMSNPDTVPQCIKSLSNTTFVAEVTAPALAVLVPLLIRALNDRSMEVQRRSVVVIDNLVKLVRDPNVAATYLSPLVEGVEKIAKGAAFPEVCWISVRILTTRTDDVLRCVPSPRPPSPRYRSPAHPKMALLPLLATLRPRLPKSSPPCSHSSPRTWLSSPRVLPTGPMLPGTHF